ncbi:MAG TPA: glutamate racemase [Deltaproteobacteria bacterium]|jgi:glutamate racemase|nr:glutamate racemase [Deltaproteobacteria bacterium]HOI07607.1 glutamate racemase [Deltaproteobacteria bacterium]
MEKSTTIGIFDSGIGGITVLKEILDLVPDADILYLGDSARLPYGTKSPKTIVRYSLQCADFLVSKGIDMLVVACNTASSHAIPDLKKMYDIPVIGVVESGSKAAIETGAGRIGVIGTPSTIKSGSYDLALRALKPEVEVFSKACPLFVSLVEEGWCSDSITEQVAARYLDDLIRANVDTLLLGCTHYPLLKGVIARVMGDKVTIVDSARSTASVVHGLLDGRPRARGHQSLVFYLSDLSPTFIKLGELFLGKKMEQVHEVDLCL